MGYVQGATGETGVAQACYEVELHVAAGASYGRYGQRKVGRGDDAEIILFYNGWGINIADLKNQICLTWCVQQQYILSFRASIRE